MNTMEEFNVNMVVDLITLKNCHLVADALIEKDSGLAEALHDELQAQIFFQSITEEDE
jgi:hypothetical protein